MQPELVDGCRGATGGKDATVIALVSTYVTTSSPYLVSPVITSRYLNRQDGSSTQVVYAYILLSKHE